MSTPPNPVNQQDAAVLLRLGYDPADAKKGLEQSRRDLAKYKEEAERLDTDLKRARIDNTAQFSREQRRAIEEQMRSLRTEIAVATGAIRGKRGAERQAAQERARELKEEFRGEQTKLKLFEEQRLKVIQLQRAHVEAGNAARRAQQAQSLFTRVGQETGQIPNARQALAEEIKRAFLESNLLRLLGPVGQAGIGGASQFAGAGFGLRGGAFAIAAAPLAIQQVASALKDAALEGGRYADEIEEAGQKTGIASPELLRLAALGKTVGLDLSDMVVATRSLARAITGDGGEDGLEEGASRASKVLAALGIETRDAQGNARKMVDVLLDFGDATRDLPAPDKIRVFMEVLGRAGQGFIPLFSRGREGVRAFLQELEQFIPNLAVAGNAFNELEMAQARYELSLLGLKTQLSENIIPLVTSFTSNMAALLSIWKQLGSLGVLDFLATGRVPDLPAGIAERAKGLRLGSLVATSPGIQSEFEELAKDIESARRSARLFGTAGEIGNRILARARSGEGALGSRGINVEDLPTERARSEALAVSALLVEGKLKEAEAQKQVTVEKQNTVDKLRAVLAGEKIAAEAKREAAKLEELRTREVELRVDLADALAQAEIKSAETETIKLAAIQTRRDAIERELANLRLQEEINGQITDSVKSGTKERLAAQELVNDSLKRASELIREGGTLTKEQADIVARMLRDVPIISTRTGGASLRPAPAPTSTRDFAGELADLRVQEALGVSVLKSELAVREALNQSLIKQIKLRLASGVATEREQQALEELLRDLKQNRDALGKLKGEGFKASSLGQFLNGLQEFSNIVSRFAPSLSKGLGSVFALFEGLQAVFDQLRVLGGGTRNEAGQVIGGSIFGGIGRIFRGGGSSTGGGRLAGLLGLIGGGVGAGQLIASLLGGGRGFSGPGRGALSGAALGTIGGLGASAGILAASGFALTPQAILAAAFTGPLAPFVLAGIGLTAGIGALVGGQKKKTRKIAQEIRDELKDVLGAFNEGRSNLKDTIAALERERADAIRRLSGRKGASGELKSITDEIDKQLGELRSRQKQILDDFAAKLGILSLPEGARDAAEAIAAIARELKNAADAGATADQQIQFLNRSLEDLKTSIGRDLRDEEQETIDLLLQQIDLQKQRADIEKQAADAELAVRQRFGLARALSPEQAAAREIADIRKRRDEELKRLDEEAKRLEVELGTRSELFDLNMEGLDVDAQRTSLMDRQLEIQRSITAELIAQIQAQQSFFAELAAGRIPALPAGVLPGGFSTPTGANFQIGSIQIVLGTGANRADAEEIGRSLIAGMMREARIRQEQGFST